MTKQIDIKELIPFIVSGYLAMDRNEEWWWYDECPIFDERNACWRTDDEYTFNIAKLKNIKPVEDWTKSLIKVENDNAI